MPPLVIRAAKDISIHALREEGDALEHTSISGQRNFYPRPPRGGRPLMPQSR